MVESNNPLAFFEDFFPDGFDKLYNDFFKFNTKTRDEDSNQEAYYMVEYNKDEDFIVIEEAAFANFELTGENEARRFAKYFNKELEQKLNYELNLSKEQIVKNYFNKGDSEQKTYLNTLFAEIEYLLINKVCDICKPKYISQCEDYFIQFVRDISLRFKFIPESKSLNKYLKPETNSLNHSLKMSKPQFKKLSVLLDALKEQGFVEKNLPLDVFQKAFDGSVIEKPLGIKWTKLTQDRLKCYYGTALELVEQLEKKKYISGFSFKQLSNIFIQANGSLITDWKGARDRKKKLKKGRGDALEEIEAIVNSF